MSMAAPIVSAVMVIIAVIIIAGLFSSLLLLNNVMVSAVKETRLEGAVLKIVNATITPQSTCNLLVFNITNDGSTSTVIDHRAELLVIYTESANKTRKYLIQFYGRDWVITELIIDNKSLAVPQGRALQLLPGMVAEAYSCLPLDISLNDSVVLVLTTKTGEVSQYVV
jgi:archaellum component FlaF (FlaF/FlaG flagellin family)